MKSGILLFVALAATAFVAGACSKKIGDDCKINPDCDPEGDRLCDLSQPGGYCTIDGCDERSCPEEAACIRFFPQRNLGKECKEDPNVCAADEICVPDAVCANGNRSSCCAPRVTERRYCALKCGGSGDCRGGYECREAGTRGSLALTTRPEARVRFCAVNAP